MSKKWYVVHAYSQYENHVRKALLDRVERAGLTDFFGDILVPTEEVVEIREGQKRTTERKFFPGYVLVQMEMNDETWHLVKSVPKVLGFIGGTSDRPAPISDREADQILNRVEESVEERAERAESRVDAPVSQCGERLLSLLRMRCVNGRCRYSLV